MKTHMSDLLVPCIAATIASLLVNLPGKDSAMAAEPAVRAVDFESRVVYRPPRDPFYACWVSFFPGENGQWYLGFEEVSRPAEPLPRSSAEHWFAMCLPVGYDKSQYLMEAVLLESRDNLATWQEISREPYHFQHTVGQFGQARTRDGRFLRFVWSCYTLDPEFGAPTEILFESADNGKTWVKQPPFHDPHFVSNPHRLRTLRDGTLVACVPLQPRWGPGQPRPTRACSDPAAVCEMQMNLFFSFDAGRSWTGPLPIYPGQNVSETDFVELEDGSLLFFNNSIFNNPGRQFVYRDGNRFSAGPLERVRAGTVPETVCLTPDGILVGTMRAGRYYWSDDLGQTWFPLAGIPAGTNGQVYQPYIQQLDDGRIACAGHLGADDPIRTRSRRNDLYLHLFRLDVRQLTRDVNITVQRDYDPETERYPNRYTLKLTAAGNPVPDAELEFWYAKRYEPGYFDFGGVPVEERMQAGGTILKVTTAADGTAQVALPELDKVTNVHLSYQFVVRFNMDRVNPDYIPAQSCLYSFYANYGQDPPLEPIAE